MYNTNYGFNPYYQQQRYQPMEQPSQQPLFNAVQRCSTLNGKLVESVDVVKSMDIPMDGSVNYFPLADGSAIVTKQFLNDGTTKTNIFELNNKPAEKPIYMTKDDFKKSMEDYNLDDLKDDILELKQEIKDLKKRKKDE